MTSREDRIKAWEKEARSVKSDGCYKITAREVDEALALMREPHPVVVPEEVLRIAKEVANGEDAWMSGIEKAANWILSLPSSPTPPVADSAKVERLRAELADANLTSDGRRIVLDAIGEELAKRGFDLPLAEAFGGSMRELEQLRAENAKLRAEVIEAQDEMAKANKLADLMHKEYVRVQDNLDRLQTGVGNRCTGAPCTCQGGLR